MAGNPNVNLGSLNPVLASIIIPAYPALNITPPFLSKDAITWEPQGNASTPLPGMTGLIQSPEPYIPVKVTMHLLKSLAIADQWLDQTELITLLGAVTVRFDLPVMNPRYLQNCSIENIGTISASGMDPAVVVAFSGTWNINGLLWQ